MAKLPTIDELFEKYDMSSDQKNKEFRDDLVHIASQSTKVTALTGLRIPGNAGLQALMMGAWLYGYHRAKSGDQIQITESGGN